MPDIHQGDVLLLSDPPVSVLVLSKDFFNRTGMAVVCPVARNAPEDALHILVTTENSKGIALLEQLRSLDLKARFYKKTGSVTFDQIQNLTDAAQSIFDYYPYSLSR